MCSFRCGFTVSFSSLCLGFHSCSRAIRGKIPFCQECPHVPQLRAALASRQRWFFHPLCGWHTSQPELCQGRCSLLLWKSDHKIHPSLQASLPCLHHIPWVTSGPAPLCPTFLKLLLNLPSLGNKANFQQAPRARIRKQLQWLSSQGQFKKLFARFSYC